VKLALRGFTPVQIVFVRLALGVAVLAPVALAQRLTPPSGWRIWGHLTVAAMFANAIPYMLVATAEQTVGSHVAGALNATTPLWTISLAFASRAERGFGFRRSLGLLAGFAGTVLIFSPWSATSEITSIGGMESLAAAASYGLGYIYMARFLTGKGVRPLMLSTSQLAAATVIMGVAVPVGGLEVPTWDAQALAGLLILGAISTGTAYVLNYRLITDAGPTAASTVTYLLPVVAVVLGWAVLGEALNGGILGGLALVLCGVALAQSRLTTRELSEMPGC
jgi:drug/metabolite transporter (DMT)-like permease